MKECQGCQILCGRRNGRHPDDLLPTWRTISQKLSWKDTTVFLSFWVSNLGHNQGHKFNSQGFVPFRQVFAGVVPSDVKNMSELPLNLSPKWWRMKLWLLFHIGWPNCKLDEILVWCRQQKQNLPLLANWVVFIKNIADIVPLPYTHNVFIFALNRAIPLYKLLSWTPWLLLKSRLSWQLPKQTSK